MSTESDRPNKIPATSLLVKFECVGRLGSVTGAASELGTSAASLSRGMRSLERQLSAQLLKRHGNGVRLTEAGRRYHRGVIAALNRLHASAEAATQLSQGTSLVIACSLDDSHLLLIPRYGDLERVLGEETRIRLLTYHRSERELRPVDMADIVLSWRTADAVRRQHAVLVTEAIQPVCSPAYLAAHKRICKDPARVGAA